MYSGPTANFVAGQLVACYENSCEKYNDNDKSWTKIADTKSRREYHSSAQHGDRILLIGGGDLDGAMVLSMSYSPGTGLWLSPVRGDPLGRV